MDGRSLGMPVVTEHSETTSGHAPSRRSAALDPTVSARQLLRLFDCAYLAALSVWLCTALWSTFVLEGVRGEKDARPSRAFLARLFAAGATAGAVSLAALVCGALSVPELRGPRILAQAMFIIVSTALMLYGANRVAPALHDAWERGGANDAEASKLRRRGILVNGAVFAAALVLFAAFMTRPALKTPGILELTPQERLRRAQEAFLKARERFEKSKPDAALRQPGAQPPTSPPP
jgi:hypothetical protein